MGRRRDLLRKMIAIFVVGFGIGNIFAIDWHALEEASQFAKRMDWVYLVFLAICVSVILNLEKFLACFLADCSRSPLGPDLKRAFRVMVALILLASAVLLLFQIELLGLRTVFAAQIF